MGIKYKSFELLRGQINNSLTDVTKCYILINYAENTEEEKEILKDEFKVRYNNFCKTIMDVEQIVDEAYISSESYKRILDLDFYKENMKNSEIEEIENDEEINEMYYEKANSSSTRMNFYYNNKAEFGPTTRFHVETTKNGLINPTAKDEAEKKFIFETITEYYEKNYLNKPKTYTKRV